MGQRHDNGGAATTLVGAAIFLERRLADDPKTLEELRAVYHVSRERIRQIEVRAFEKVREAIQHIAAERRLLAA